MALQQIIKTLRSHANPKNVAGMARFGINPKNTLGIGIPFLRQLGKKIGRNHELAGQLWKTKIHEARLLAAFIEEPKKVTSVQMDRWTADFDSWDICDQVCSNVYDKTPFAYDKSLKWVKDKREFVRRAGFVMMAALAVHDKKQPDKTFVQFFPIIKKYSTDERNFVRKAVNWALRQIGKRSDWLKSRAITCATEIQRFNSKSARWIAGDALRELSSRR
jgi:3-methyladenine DNA glycosylase AlkD